MRSTTMYVLGNTWLFLAVMLFFGKGIALSGPTHYHVFGINSWMISPIQYNLSLAACVTMGLLNWRWSLTPQVA